MSDYWSESEGYSNVFTSSESSQTTPFTDRIEFNFYVGDEASQLFPGTAIPIRPSDNTINPQWLDKPAENAQQSFNAVGDWTEPFSPNGTSPSIPYRGFSPAAAAGALQSVQDRASAQVNAPPWTPAPQTLDDPYQAFEESPSTGPAWTGPGALLNEPPNMSGNVYEARQAMDFASTLPAATAYTTGLYSLTPADRPVRTETFAVPDKRPIDRLPPTSSSSDSSSSGSFVCDECRETFTREHDLDRHTLGKHDFPGPFHRCSKCGWDDFRLYNVKNHCRTKHLQQAGSEQIEGAFGRPGRLKRDRAPNKSGQNGRRR